MRHKKMHKFEHFSVVRQYILGVEDNVIYCLVRKFNRLPSGGRILKSS